MNKEIMESIESMAKILNSDCYSIIISLLESGIIGSKLADELSTQIFKD